MTPLTMSNVEAVLDAGQLYVAMTNGKWRKIRRNGKTKRWVRDKNRIRISFKHGLYGHGQITETDFQASGYMRGDCFRHEADLELGQIVKVKELPR